MKPRLVASHQLISLSIGCGVRRIKYPAILRLGSHKGNHVVKALSPGKKTLSDLFAFAHRFSKSRGPGLGWGGRSVVTFLSVFGRKKDYPGWFALLSKGLARATHAVLLNPEQVRSPSLCASQYCFLKVNLNKKIESVLFEIYMLITQSFSRTPLCWELILPTYYCTPSILHTPQRL